MTQRRRLVSNDNTVPTEQLSTLDPLSVPFSTSSTYDDVRRAFQIAGENAIIKLALEHIPQHLLSEFVKRKLRCRLVEIPYAIRSLVHAHLDAESHFRWAQTSRKCHIISKLPASSPFSVRVHAKAIFMFPDSFVTLKPHTLDLNLAQGHYLSTANIVALSTMISICKLSLEVFSHHDVPEQDYRSLSNLHGLTDLDLQVGITTILSGFLYACGRRLKKLSLTHIQTYNSHGSQISLYYDGLSNCPRLATLSLHRLDLESKDNIVALSKLSEICPELRNMIASFDNKAADLDFLHNLTQLDRIEIIGHNITKLPTLPFIKELNLSGSWVPLCTLHAWSSLQSLRPSGYLGLIANDVATLPSSLTELDLRMTSAIPHALAFALTSTPLTRIKQLPKSAQLKRVILHRKAHYSTGTPHGLLIREDFDRASAMNGIEFVWV